MRICLLAFVAFALFVFSADADWHYSCTCHNGGSYIWRITTKACDAYNQHIDSEWPDSENHVRYDTPSGRCTSVGPGGNVIDGDTMESVCKNTGTNGFPCEHDNSKTCFANPGSISSWCD
ncbi:uncharacterized protein CTRU02_210659 [Colletotrichum truncatum]|uniref:Uncharacterized protein n=1 Tax=Colletotrichum truncatum TaxID=5467 RepID=A0ACC3YPM9_COLTU